MTAIDETKAEMAEEKTEAADALTAFEEWLETQPEASKTSFAKQLAGLKSALVKERETNKGVKPQLARLQELEKAEEKRKTESQSELEKAQAATTAAKAEAAQAKADLQAERINSAIIAEATRMHFADPDDAVQFVKTSDLEISAEGKITNIKEVIASLAKAKPYLVGESVASNGTNINAGEGTKSRNAAQVVQSSIVAQKRGSGEYSDF